MALGLLATSCVQNEATGEMEPKWVFWVFLGLILFGLIFGAIVTSMRRNKNNGTQSQDKTSREIENYEETLRKKEEEKEDK